MVKLSSLFSSVWDFSDKTAYLYDENFVEIKNGTARLIPQVLEHSGVDFSNGALTGTYSNNNDLSLNTDQVSHIPHINNILTSQAIHLTGYWSFENTKIDQSSYNRSPITDSGLSFSTDAVNGNNSLNFTDTDSGELAYDFSELNNQGTFNFWVKQELGSIYEYIFDTSPAAGNRFLLHQRVTGQWQMFINGVLITDDAPLSVAQGSWNMITITYDMSSINNNVSLYENGHKLNDYSVDLGTLNAPSFIHFGKRNVSLGGDYWNGLMDEISIHKSVLSQSEIKLLYTAYAPQYSDNTALSPLWTPKYNDLIGYWKIDGNWQDSSANGNHASVSGTGPVINFSDVKVGSGKGVFDGDNGDVTVQTHTFAINQPITIAAWIKPGPNTTNNHFLFISRTGSAQAILGIVLNSGRLAIQQGTDWGVISTSLIEQNVWTHVSFTRYTNGEYHLYLNGELDAIGTDKIGIDAMGGSTFRFGGSINDPLYRFLGEMDDVALWNKNLSLSEIQLIYNRQKQLYAGNYDSQVIDLASPSSLWPDLSWSTTLPFGKELIADFNSDASADIESVIDYPGLTGNLSDGLAGSWPFNEKLINSVSPSGEDFSDTSGNGNHGTQDGGVVLNNPGIFNSALSFDGIDDRVEFTVNASLQIGFDSDFSASVWAKIPAEQADINSQTNRIWVLAPSGTTSTSLSLRNQSSSLNGKITLAKNNGSTNLLMNSSASINDNEFHHLFVKKEANTLSLYIDGVLDSQMTDTAPSASNYAFFRLGRNSAVTQALKAQLDEVAIWSRSLSDNEIQQLYRRGANRIKMQIKSCVDSNCFCKSFSSTPSGNSLDCDGDGVVNEFDSDDTHKSKFIGPGGDTSTYYSELYNRLQTDVIFNCALNTTDSLPGVCAADEISVKATPKPTGPHFLTTDFTQFVRPAANRYAQYRVYMEADKNTACSGSPCFPQLTSVKLAGATGYPRQAQMVKPLQPISYSNIHSASIDADDCVKFQLSPNDIDYYYWNPTSLSWVIATDNNVHLTSKQNVIDHIVKYSTDRGSGDLHIKAYLSTNASRSTNCELRDIDINFTAN